jgi:hypothetical protein
MYNNYMDDLNPLNKKNVDALTSPDATGNMNSDTYAAGGGAEREAKTTQLSIGEASRLAGHLAREQQKRADEAGSAAYGRNAERYNGIHRVLSEFPDFNSAPEDNIDDLQQILDSEIRRARAPHIKNDPDKLAAAHKDIADTDAAISFLEGQNENVERTRESLKQRDEAALENTPVSSAQLREYASLLSQQAQARSESASIAGDKNESSRLGGIADHYKDIQDELENATHENGVPMTLEQTRAYLEKSLDKQNSLIDQYGLDDDRGMDAEEKVAILEAVEKFILNNVPDGEGTKNFDRILADQRMRTEQIKREITLSRRHREETHDTQDIDETREALRDELILDTIMTVGGFEIIASLPPGYHTGFNGDKRYGQLYGYYPDRNSRFPQNSHLRITGISGVNLGSTIDMRELGDQGVHEILACAPVTQSVYTEKTRTVKGGLREFFQSREETYQEYAGNRQPTFAEIVPGADPKYGNESAVSLRYQTDLYSGTELRKTEFNMTLVLPESVAKELMSQAKSDPELMHRLVDRVAVGDDKDTGNSVGLDQNVWHKGIEGKTSRGARPPYEEWAKANGGKTRTYIVEGLIDSAQLDPKNIATSK